MNVLTFLASVATDSSFIKLFAEMHPWCIALFIVGIIFCAIEVFIPGFGFFGIAGGVCIIVGIVLRLAMGGDGWMLVYMLLIFAAIITLMLLLVSKVVRKGKISKTEIFNVNSSVGEDRTEGTKDFSYLMDKIGVTQTLLRPVGKAVFDNNPIDVVAQNGYIAENVQVKVVAIEGQRVVVIEYKGE